MAIGFGVETPGSPFSVPGCLMCQGLGADEAEGDRERGKGSEGNERFGKACARRAEAGIDQGVPMIQSPFTCCPALALQPPLSPSGTGPPWLRCLLPPTDGWTDGKGFAKPCCVLLLHWWGPHFQDEI